MDDEEYDVPGGPRLPWADLPAAVRRAVENHLGSPVVTAVSQVGGFSPGTAARVQCEDGRRAFVKCVGTQLNKHTPDMHRSEARVAGALPASVPSPRLRYVHDDGDWVALVFDEALGSLPRLPWSAATAHRVAEAIEDLSSSLTPCPLPEVLNIADRLREDLTAWQRLATDPPADLDFWELGNLDRLAALSADLAATDGPLTGDTLVHLDLRADNILLESGDRVLFVDWPWACRGPIWVDSVLFALDPFVHGGLDPELLLAGRPVMDGAGPADVTALLLGLAGMWAEAFRVPAPPTMPTIRAHQRRFHDAALEWGRRRCGWS
ncbi:MAG: phosphotransferase [Geodermatophilaceae bacterium]|nr:phosphotransferase [Geodermatophilaceae bacterium]